MKKLLTALLCLLVAVSTFAQTAPQAPDLSGWKDKSVDERKAAYEQQFKLTVDTKRGTFKMGADGTFYPIGQWMPVFQQYPDVEKLAKEYNGKLRTSLVMLGVGTVLLIPGMVMSMVGPFLVGLIFDVASLTVDLTALLFIPKESTLAEAEQAFNAHTLAALGLN